MAALPWPQPARLAAGHGGRIAVRFDQLVCFTRSRRWRLSPLRRQMSDLREWLDSVGLGQYADAFAEHDIDFHVLPDLNEQDLEKLGVSLGHRKKLLKALAEHRLKFLPAAKRDDEVKPSPVETRGGAEKRHLTVLFCDL